MQAIVYLCFLLSGVTGLVYEVLWGKYLQLFIGASSYAHTVVLATFMGGLALGNALFGRLADRLDRKLTLYAALELGIGLTCALFPLLYEGLSHAYLALASSDPESAWNLTLKVVFAAGAMLAPTILMGGTLPVLARYVVKHLHEVGSKVGWLYFINSAGAVAGAILAGFYLIAAYGLELSMVVTAAVNIAIGILFLALRRFERPEDTDADVNAEERAHSGARQYSDRQVRGVLVAVFATGLLTMVYELVWIRILGLVLGSSTYSFSIMLFTFIGGIALGGLLVSRIMRRDRDALRLFAVCELGVFVLLLLLMPVYERLPYYFNVLASLLVRRDEAFPIYLFFKCALAALIMAGPATLIGMTLPLASRVVVRRVRILGTGVGSVFSINTLGNVAGAILTGFVLIPTLGLQTTLMTGIALTGVAGAALFALATQRRRTQLAVGVGVAVVYLLGMVALPDWNVWLLNAGMFRQTYRYAPTWESYAHDLSINEMLFHKDGPDVSVVVMRRRDDPGAIWLKVNGKTDASTMADVATQFHLGHVPALLHPGPKTALVIGLGSGLTANAVLAHPVENLDVVEISDAVVEAHRYFSAVFPSPLDDPRTRLVRADARDFLLLQPEARYDLIISEPSNPWIAGIGNLFTREFFAQEAAHLAPGGIMCQWVHLYEMEDSQATVIFNTFSSVFPHVTVWHPGTKDVLLVGSANPLQLDFAAMERRIASPAVQAHFQHPRLPQKIDGLLEFLAMQILASDGFKRAWTGQGRLNVDLFPLLEYEAPRAFFVRAEATRLHSLDQRTDRRADNPLYVAQWLGDRALETDEVKALIRAFAARNTVLDHAILPGLVEAFARRSGTESVSAELLLQPYNRNVYGPRSLWRRRIEAGAMAAEEWPVYLSFEASLLRRFSNVFVTPDTTWFEEALRNCLERFPDRREEFLRKAEQTWRVIGKDQ